MALAPTQKPDDNAGGGNVSGTDPSSAFSGTRDHDDDPTNMTGQYPPGPWGDAIFGGTLPAGTGAPGTQGAVDGSGADPTNQPGQTDDGFTGLPGSDITQSGLPGSATDANPDVAGATPVSYSQPGAYLSGTNQSEEIAQNIDGPADSTGANSEGYATSGPKLPGMQEPAAGSGRFQPQSGGRVLRGGRSVRP